MKTGNKTVGQVITESILQAALPLVVIWALAHHVGHYYWFWVALYCSAVHFVTRVVLFFGIGTAIALEHFSANGKSSEITQEEASRFALILRARIYVAYLALKIPYYAVLLFCGAHIVSSFLSL